MYRKKSSAWAVLNVILVTSALALAVAAGGGVAFGSQDAQAVTTVIVMRHAEKASSEGDPDLTPEGKERADHLKQVLGWLPISAVFSTCAKRALQTAEPLAQCLGLTVKPYKTIAEVVEKIRSPEFQGKTVFVMGHMGTARDLIDNLGGTGTACPGFNHDEICFAQITSDNKVQVLRFKYGTILEPVKCTQRPSPSKPCEP
jgi:broad specificity phosphatase PhoE